MNNVDNPFESPSILSICPGILGLERGLERAIGRTRTIAYVEIEAFAVENLLAGMEAGVLAPAPIWTNLKTFDAQPFRGKICGIVGGYPCQPFSTAGKQEGVEDPRHLWPFIAGIMRTTRPLWGFFENVAAHAHEGFDQVYRDLHEMGYRIEAGIFAAEEVGAPHRRERLFILAILADAESAGVWGKARDVYKADGRSDEQMQLIADGPGEFNPFGEELAYTPGERQPQQRNDREQAGKENNRIGCTSSTGVGHADSCCEGLEKLGNGIREEKTFAKSHQSGLRWPARPGQSQYDWEAPRTIEPGMGLTAHGYNFREDLLRAAGNSVVEQQAEYAFRILMKKHFG